MKRLVAVIATFEAFSIALLTLNLWFFAFLGGDTLSITINQHGERWVEYGLWLVLTPVLVLGFHYTIEEFSAPE